MGKTNELANSTKLKSLEVLRVVAALLVVFAHQPRIDIPVVEWFFGSKLFSGAIGVDIFFIISGFVIASTTKNLGGGRKGALEFLSKRIVRIFPLYWFMTILAFGPLEWDRSYFIKSLVLFPDSSHGFNPAINVAWSLQYEIYFYLIFTIGILIKRRTSTTIFILTMSVFACYKFGYYFGTPIVLEFLFGVCLWHLLEKHSITFNKVRKKYLIIGLFVSSALLLFVSIGHDSNLTSFANTIVPRIEINYGSLLLPRYLIWGLPAALLVLSALLLEKFLTWRFWILGKYTYSMYLWQGFPIPITTTVFSKSSALGIVAYFAQLSLVSFMSYKIIELPYIKWRVNSK